LPWKGQKHFLKIYCMKNIILLFLLILFTASVHAQPAAMVIAGKTDGSIPHLILAWEEQDGIVKVADTIKVKQNNTFRHHVRLEKPTLGFLTVQGKGYKVWLQPGSSLSISLKYGQPTFSGEAGAYAAYFLEDQQLHVKSSQDYANKYPDFQNSAAGFFSYLDTTTLQRINFLKSYQHKLGTNGKDAFLTQARLSLIYDNLLSKLMSGKADVTQFKIYQDSYKVSEPHYYAFSENIDLGDALHLTNPYCRRFMSQFIGDIARDRQMAGGQKFSIEPYLHHAMLVVDELTTDTSTNTKIKALFLNNLVEEINQRKKVEWIGSVNATLAELTSKYDNVNLQLVQGKLDRITATDTRFSKGNPAPAFTLEDAKGKSYTLQDFKGKKVYMDLGAAWCGWCIKGVPAWNKLVEQNAKNKDVVFISIGMDEEEATWRGWTEKHKLKGLLLYAGEGGMKSKFGTDYQIQSLPRFILLDEEGRIEAFSAPNPEQFQEELLSKEGNK
jgi:thiol-disulfide isomerase/thioredoxin